MFEEVLSKKAKASLAILGESKLLDNAYLAGGTALALQLGHRLSKDFDFFTSDSFDAEIFIQRFVALQINFKLERTAWGTILGYVGSSRFSLFFYNYPILAKPQRFLDVNVASYQDISAMKLAAIADRGTKRDFVDLYFIVSHKKIFTLKEVFDLYDRKFKVLKQNKLHIIKSLSYFEDADQDKLPHLFVDVDWKNVKKFFIEQSKILAKEFLGV